MNVWSVACLLILLLSAFSAQCTHITTSGSAQDILVEVVSARVPLADAVIVPESEPFFALLGASAACWYNKPENKTGLLPLLVQNQGTLTDAQQRFLETYLPSSSPTLLILGQPLNTSYDAQEVLGSPAEVSCLLAQQMFTMASTVLVLPYNTSTAYQLSVLVTPLSCYLGIPILFYDNNEENLQTVCDELQVTQAYVVGNVEVNLTNVSCIWLVDEEMISHTLLNVIKEQFGVINYLTMTNPSDVRPPVVIDETKTTIVDHLTNRKLIVLSKEWNLNGNDTKRYSFDVPDGIIRIQITGELYQKQTLFFRRFSAVVPLLFMTLTDPQGNIVAYANSMGCEIGKTYGETLACNASGSYILEVEAYYGIKGGFFIQRGFSCLDADIQITVTVSKLAAPHLPLIPNLSMMAPYLTAAHGGLLLANSSWGLTESSYEAAAQGQGTGPWYTESLHPFTNEKVNITVRELNETLHLLEAHGLRSGYITGPAWLAILADTTMVPMYYYGPSQEDIPDRGLPSDNPYSLSQSLSVGRVIGWDVQDVSVLIARTLFYETVCGPPEDLDDWHQRFSFVFGEGFSETGGFFHQVPYAKEIRVYGFDSQVYGDLRNSRQFIEFFHIFTGSNYIEYLGHGDWFWFPASMYGLDMYSKAVDVAHAKNWVFEKPSIFLTSACLMGRTDGLPPQMTIGLAMLHAGCNGFVGATRETGQEAGLTVLENHLIVDDWSLGEALRGEKQVDRELPTFFVRVLYGDPAFNPFEPAHGFSDQGRPQFKEL